MTWHIASAAVLVSLEQTGERDLGYGVEGPLRVVRIDLQVLEEVGPEPVGRLVVGAQDGHEAPPLLATVRLDGLVVGRLLHQLAVDLRIDEFQS